ncbi:MAG: 4-oxalocrotonate tautomerase [bacterium P3]|nr:MAG: 4-oxalocrotonate tautomerase [bacterium P3]KWW26877.1 MAG: 4-oxalocrotonate tautomerase [bacterium F083]
MPHINIKCYPKHLTENEMKSFITELTQLTEKHLKASENYVSISYTEIPAEQWKEEVYDKEIRPNLGTLAKEPGYDM